MTTFIAENQATYSPEDNKIRIYLTERLSKEDWLKLKKAGYSWTMKQESDLAATWSPSREDLAFEFCGDIEDHDIDTRADRAADRAERFAGYRDKRENEARESLDNTVEAIGMQSEKKAATVARRSQRAATKATNNWNKAEYWQQRTAGVIANALHLKKPSVRMGRIKRIETELRKLIKSRAEAIKSQQHRYDCIQSFVDYSEGKREKVLCYDRFSLSYAKSTYPDINIATLNLYCCLDISVYGLDESYRQSQELKKQKVLAGEGLQVAKEWIACNPRLEDFKENRWTEHLKLRLVYENQMLEAVGGMQSEQDIKAGGYYGGCLIHKVNKSSATKRVCSVSVEVPSTDKYDYRVTKVCAEYSLMKFNIERENGKSKSYTPPTTESKQLLKERKQLAKKNKPKKASLINPTIQEAQRLQDLINDMAKARCIKAYGCDTDVTDEQLKNYGFEYARVIEMTQQKYAIVSKGTYSRAGTQHYNALGKKPKSRYYKEDLSKVICKVRQIRDINGIYSPDSIIVLTDKPQKKFPEALFAEPITKEVKEYAEV